MSWVAKLTAAARLTERVNENRFFVYICPFVEFTTKIYRFICSFFFYSFRFPSSSGGIRCWGEDLIFTLCLITKTKKYIYILNHPSERESSPQPSRLQSLVLLRHDGLIFNYQFLRSGRQNVFAASKKKSQPNVSFLYRERKGWASSFPFGK